jgi:hypothetical protein
MEMTPMARFLVLLNLAILLVGLLWPYLSRIGLGRLPGDIINRAGQCDVLLPLSDVPAAERAVQPGLLGRQPMKTHCTATGT